MFEFYWQARGLIEIAKDATTKKLLIYYVDRPMLLAPRLEAFAVFRGVNVRVIVAP